MSRLYSGIDIIEISRIAEVIERWGEAFLNRIYTPGELELCRMRPSSLAARFAAKEAVIKVLGGEGGIRWKDIEILTDSSGRPLVFLHDNACKSAGDLGLEGISVSLSHSRQHAVAMAVGIPVGTVK